MYGALTYLFISFSLRYSIPHHHRKGMNHVRNQKFNEAISEFENSYAYFSKNEWIDKYRFITVLNSNKMSYKEMALNNIAFCYGQIGDGAKAKEWYQKALNEFPESGLAKAGLNMLNSIRPETIMIKARHTKVNQYKVLPNGDTVVYEDFKAYPSGISNIYCMDENKEIKWYAELPFEDDVFTGLIAWDSGYDKEAKERDDAYVPNSSSFVAYACCGIIGSFSYETGKIIESELIK